MLPVLEPKDCGLGFLYRKRFLSCHPHLDPFMNNLNENLHKGDWNGIGSSLLLVWNELPKPDGPWQQFARYTILARAIRGLAKRAPEISQHFVDRVALQQREARVEFAVTQVVDFAMVAFASGLETSVRSVLVAIPGDRETEYEAGWNSYAKLFWRHRLPWSQLLPEGL